MKNKWSIIMLGLLGVMAALCAAVLTASIRAHDITDDIQMLSPDVTILVAARDIPPMTITGADAVTEKTVARDQAPEGYFSESTQIVGKVLAAPMVKGQVFTPTSFPREGSGAYLASFLPKGKRAVCISLSDYSGMEGLLYPGCVVDVLASFKVSSKVKLGEAVSTTLLTSIQVMAVENQTVASYDEGKEETQSPNSTRQKLLVTLMVESKQAEALQLAMENGRISLAMRNPNDALEVDKDATLLSEGRLAQLARLLAPNVRTESPGLTAMELEIPTNLELPSGRIAAEETEKEPHKPDPKPVPVPTIDVDVIRGITSETKSFPLPTS